MSGTRVPCSIGEDHATAIQVQRYHDCFHHCSGPPAGSLWQRGGHSEALGRSRGGLSTSIYSLMSFTSVGMGNMIDIGMLTCWSEHPQQ